MVERSAGVDLTGFGLSQGLRTSREIRRATKGQPTMESAARMICRWLFDFLKAPDGSRGCVLVRCYKTHAFGALPVDLQRFARRAGEFTASPDPAMKCLTLLATMGERPTWTMRRSSKGHQAIPLPSARVLQRTPMIAQLVSDFGLDVSQVIAPSPDIVSDLSGKSYGVFHVEEAKGSPAIPAQEDFVERFGVRSVIGFGGLLASGDLYAVILFTRVHVGAPAAERFRSVALDVKAAFFPYTEATTFDPRPDTGETPAPDDSVTG